MDKSFTRKISPATPHLCDLPNQQIDKDVFMNSCIALINENPASTLFDVYSRTASKACVTNIPQFNEIRSALYRYRQKFIPPSPKSIAEINFSHEYTVTTNRQQYLWHHDAEIGVTIFCTEPSLNLSSKR